jgi:carbamoyltransferase
MTDAYLGPSYSPAQIRRALAAENVVFEEMDEADLVGTVADKIAQDKIVGWFQGRMEIGPRALGNRSILANPCNPAMKDILNLRVKHREPFRPFAPVVLEERAAEYFDLPGNSPFMLLSPRVRDDKKAVIPAVTHVDGTARVQTVSRESNPLLWRLVSAFADKTGVPVIINTSFNLRGEPVVCAPQDALRTFLATEMDYLVLGNFLVTRHPQGAVVSDGK